jgi:hypothetical protein
MLSQQIKNSGSLLDSIDAVRNWRAVVLLLITLVAGALVAGIGTLLSSVSFFFVFVFALLAWAVVFYGGNAVGMMVMDEARGERSRPMMAAVMASLHCSHRLILVFLLIGALYLVGLLALALILLICKIPFLGPVLYTVVFPVSAVIVGIAMFAVPTVVFPLSAPSIWSGAKTMECVSQLLAIARKRLIMVLILMVAVAFISGVVAMLIGMILLFGSVTVGSMSAGILGGMGSFGAMSGMGGGMGGMPMGMGALGGHAMAAMIGGGILYAAAFTLPGMVYLRGACTVYLRAIDGLDLASEQAAMDEKIAAARAKAREMQEQAQAQAQKYAQQGTVTPPPMSAAPAPYAPPAAPAQTAPIASPVFVPPVGPAAPVQPPPPPPVFTPPPPPVFTPPPAPVFQPPPAPAFTPPLAPVFTPPPAPAVVPPAPVAAPDAPMVLKCPKCGAPFLPGDAFCGECGNKLR